MTKATILAMSLYVAAVLALVVVPMPQQRPRLLARLHEHYALGVGGMETLSRYAALALTRALFLTVAAPPIEWPAHLAVRAPALTAGWAYRPGPSHQIREPNGPPRRLSMAVAGMHLRDRHQASARQVLEN